MSSDESTMRLIRVLQVGQECTGCQEVWNDTNRSIFFQLSRKLEVSWSGGASLVMEVVVVCIFSLKMKPWTPKPTWRFWKIISFCYSALTSASFSTKTVHRVTSPKLSQHVSKSTRSCALIGQGTHLIWILLKMSGVSWRVGWARIHARTGVSWLTGWNTCG